MLIARNPPGEPFSGASELLPATHNAPVYYCRAGLDELLRAAIRDSLLTRRYELVVLREEQDGRLQMHCHQLFPPGAERGYSHQLTVRCAPTDDRGTVFAVVTREGRQFRPVSLQAALLAPGSYQVTAVLTRPGRVEFEGLPAELIPDQRRWPDIVRTVPDRLGSWQPVHLVCVIEISGGKQRLRRRVDRLEQLIAAADGGGRRLAVSLVSYGPHAVDRFTPEEPAATLAWATTSDRALGRLRGLINREPAEGEYHRAAQLECALTEVARQLSGRDGRPVLVTVGARPPHPPRTDHRTEIIPCRDRVDWHRPLDRLADLDGITFGALCDEDARGEIWHQLGRDALEAVEDVVDVPEFAARLGLREPVQCVPFPLIVQGGA